MSVICDKREVCGFYHCKHRMPHIAEWLPDKFGTSPVKKCNQKGGFCLYSPTNDRVCVLYTKIPDIRKLIL